jgi:hypothetical protein
MTQHKQSSLDSRSTPMDAFYDTCERTCAELRIYSGDMHPSTVTMRLGLEPTSVVAKGEASPPNSLGRTRLGTLNGWFLSSESFISSTDVRHHIDWLLGNLMQKRDALQVLQDDPGIKMGIVCPWWSQYGDGGPTLWPEQMRGMAELNLECSFSFADYSQDNVEDQQPRSSIGVESA